MRCTICGGELEATRTDLPFKVRETSIVILKRLPVMQCENCSEYLIDD
ncbi:MAG: YgiT-type zinc finger protein, partial [Armatimonadetes bacterium]|nr:YgiT-type zinc finger protein [Armatimonadota bacterium]